MDSKKSFIFCPKLFTGRVKFAVENTKQFCVDLVLKFFERTQNGFHEHVLSK